MRFPALCLLTAGLGLLAPDALTAANYYWTSTGGNWLTDNWYNAASGGSPLSAPGTADTAYIYGGVVLNGAASSANNYIDNNGIANIGNGGIWKSSGTFFVGDSGRGTLNILTSGTVLGNGSTSTYIIAGNLANGVGTINVESGGYLYTSAQIRLGNVASGTGILNIANGATVRAATGVYASLYNGSGIINIAQGGSLIIDANALYVGNGGASYANSYGEVNIDGFFQSGGNGTYYFPVGYAGVGVLNIGVTGTVLAGQLDIGREATASGTVTLAGYYKSPTGSTLVGSLGKGTFTIKPTGFFDNLAGLYIANGIGSTGTMTIEGGGKATSSTFYVGGSGDGYLYMGPGSYLLSTANSWMARNPGARGVAIVEGTWETAGSGYIVISGEGRTAAILDQSSYAELTVKPGGSIKSNTIIYMGYTVSSTGILNVDTNASAKSITYFLLGRQGYGEVNVAVGGTVSVGTNTNIADQLDGLAASPTNGQPTSIGVLNLAGYYDNGTYIRAGGAGTGIVNIFPTGTLNIRTILDIGYGATSTGTVNVEGLLKAGTNINNGVSGLGYLNISHSGTVAAGGGYTQNVNSTLKVDLALGTNGELARDPDVIFPELTAPFLSLSGAATLSGTLIVTGSGVSKISYTGGGGGKASDLSGIPVIRAAGGISGDFKVVKIDGVSTDGLPDYIRSGGMKVNEGGPVDTRYDVGFGLAWRSGAESAHGDFTVENGKTFNVDVQLSDRASGLVFTSTQNWDGKSLTKKGPGTLILSVANAYTGVTTVDEGILRFTGPAEHNIGALVNNAVVDIRDNIPTGFAMAAASADSTIYRTLRATSLAGSGTFRMNVNLAAGTCDRLIILGDATGHHHLLLSGEGNGMSSTGDEPMPVLVSIGGVNNTQFEADGTVAGSTLFDGSFDYGIFNYKVDMINGKLVIVNTGLLPASFDPIRGVPGAQSVLWFDQQDNISRRLGELRAPRETGTGADIWTRAHAAQASIGGGSTETRLSDVDLWGVEIGADYTWKFDTDSATVGAFIGYGTADQDFQKIRTSKGATGENEMIGLGVYGAWLTDSGWFANATATIVQYRNTFDAIDLAYNHTTGDYKDHGYGVNAEFGRRFDAGKGWFVEPAVQGALIRLNRGDYTTGGQGSATLSIHGTDAVINRLRGNLRVGRTWQTERAGWFELAGRVAAIRERSSGGEVSIGTANRWRPNLDGERYEAGVGFYWKPFTTGQIYLDYEYAAGDNFEKPWGISLGFRLTL